MSYRVQHITNKRKLHGPMEPEYLTIHSTANLNSTAQNERDNLNRTNNTTSTGFHIVVDEKEAIECVPLNVKTYHAGDGVNGVGNTKSIGLEICESGNRAKTIENAIKVAAKILHERSWGIDRLKRHYDWSKKDCPRILNYNNWEGWNEFKSKVQAHLNLLSYDNKTTGKLYRVQVGAYSIKANAEKMLNDLKLAGFNGFIKEDVIDVEPPKPDYLEYETSNLYIQEVIPELCYVGFGQGKNLKQLDVPGINGTWQNNKEAHLQRAIWGLCANKHGPIGPNSYQNSPHGHKRGTIVYYEDGELDITRVNNINEFKKTIIWAMGGGSLIPEIIEEEKFASDIFRNTHHTAVGIKDGRVYQIVTKKHCTMNQFKKYIEQEVNLEKAIFLDGGGSSQMNTRSGKGLYSSRGLASGLFIKGVK